MWFLALKRTLRSSNFTKYQHFSLNFGTCQDHSILDKSVSAIFQKKLVLIFICALVFFQKYAMTGVQKFLKSALIFIVSQIADPLFLVIKLICLAENFKAIA